MKFKTPLEIFSNNLWDYHIKVSSEQAVPFIEGNQRRVICKLNDTVEFPAALMPKDGGFYIMINKQTRQSLKVIEGTMLAVELCKDESKYGLPIAEEFSSVFDLDQDAFNYFSDLTPGKQRTLLHLVNKIKNSEIRINRSLAIAYHLNEVRGKLDFKKLNATIKAFNQNRKLR